jgi:hypothetical protein
MIKRGLSILVLCLFLAHFAGFYIYFFIQLKQLRSEMRAQLKNLPADQLQCIKLSNEEYKKAKVEEHEVKVDGKMYDIARIQFKADTVFVYGIHDRAEDSLLAFLDKILSLPLKDKSAPNQVLKFTALTFIVPVIFQHNISRCIIPIEETAYLLSDSTFIQLPDSPPPKA